VPRSWPTIPGRSIGSTRSTRINPGRTHLSIRIAT
jgi:hypothetical protein